MIRRILEVLALIAFLATACTAELAIRERDGQAGPTHRLEAARRVR